MRYLALGSKRISLHTIGHLLLIYFALILNQSVAMQQISRQSIGNYIVFIGICGILCCLRIPIKKDLFLFGGYLTVTVIAIRIINNGGMGLDSLVLWLNVILISYIVVMYNPNEFTKNYISVVYVLAIISIVLFIWQMVDIEGLKDILPFQGSLGQQYREYTYDGNITSSKYVNHSYNGLLFYVVNGAHTGRNVGIYTEPGVYQMVLSTAIFLLLFRENDFTQRKKTRIFIVLCAALITVQSTAGYMSLIAILFVYLTKSIGYNDKIKKMVMFAGASAVIIVLVLYLKEGVDNTFHQIVVVKILESFEKMDGRTSGGARLGVIIKCIEVILTNPWGIGFDNINNILAESVERYAGAGLMNYGAAMGLIPFVVTIVWSVKGILLHHEISRREKCLYMFLYFNAMLSQSLAFYPCLLTTALAYSYCMEPNSSLKYAGGLKN